MANETDPDSVIPTDSAASGSSPTSSPAPTSAGGVAVQVDIDALAFNKGDGLLPAIVQHALSGTVLMLGYVSAESLQMTVTTGLMTFYSRSRQQLWCKGETSGNTLQVTSIATDCDHDTLLVQALPAGPTCHLGYASCFDSREAPPHTGYGFLGALEATIHSRRHSPADSSYTASLFARGRAKMAQKVGEEGVEVALAAVLGDTRDLTNESADLLYHLLVVLADHDLSLNDVIHVLAERSGKTGLRTSPEQSPT